MCSFFQCRLGFSSPGAMMPAILKMYFIGTALAVLAVIFDIVDSFGGLMYVQDHCYTTKPDHQMQRQLSSNHQRRSAVTKQIGS
ncbi:hypothetical protein LDENG_00045610 [Lucifuga dentata]|nr:hypothetical protein LDENG_00045610 [Lucifuga dentata]